jgi:DNA polymerase-3 subunit gamma/tau
MTAMDTYVGLARKYRPQNFEDLVGQEAVAQALAQALRQNRLVHGHLMAGPRGTGKTTTARILARALNCEQGPTPIPCGKCRHCIDIAAGNDMDVIEIDGASNNGVENIRELRERINLAPFSARHKVYIIDEVHMLSSGAFNALLKTLEEPPSGVVFVMATTELEKVPETIRSRCALHQFRRLTTEDIVRRLAQVAEREGIALAPEAAREIFGHVARSVDGGMRDALMILDQLLAISDGKPTPEAAIRLLGLADASVLADAVDWMAQGKAVELLKLVDDLVGRGRSLERFVKELVAYLRDLMLLGSGIGEDLVGIGGDEALTRARSQAASLAPATLYNTINQMFALEERLKQSTQARFLLEFTFLRLAQIKPVVPLDEILRRVQALPEAALGGGSGHAATGDTSVPLSPAPSAAASQAASRGAETGAPGRVENSAEPPSARRAWAAPAGRPALAGAFMDGAPDGAQPMPAGAGGAPVADAKGQASPAALAGLDRQELVGAIVNQLPDAMQGLFQRYLSQAAGVTVADEALSIAWAEGQGLGRRIVEKPDNARALQAALAQLAGRPMAVVNMDAPVGARPGASPAASPAAATRPGAFASPVMADSASAFSAEDASPFEASDASDATGFKDASLARRSQADAPPADGRSALEKAKDFLESNDEAARRLRMLRDMLHGRLIDENGAPLALG